ncbi:hypothetical protein MPSEU_000982700 [Mayamaea pseudoterrestris]|nr:hypothetical protein MPSEU_000982700 [Mayamaea pseudoterrestris]
MYRSFEFAMHESFSRHEMSRSGDLTKTAAAAYYGERPAMASSKRPSASTTSIPPHDSNMMQHTRLYKAPQPTIRNLQSDAGGAAASNGVITAGGSNHGPLSSPPTIHLNAAPTVPHTSESKTGYARRRRQVSNTRPLPLTLEGSAAAGTIGTGFRGRLERQGSNQSLSPNADLLDISARSSRSGNEDLFRSVPDGLLWKPTYSAAASNTHLHSHEKISRGRHRHSMDLSDTSQYKHLSSNSSHHNSSNIFVSDRPPQAAPQKRSKHVSSSSSLWLCQVRSFFTPIHFFQLLALVCLTVMIYDSHHKVKAHRSRLDQYDEERSHILDQMMWMDQAAKKVHAAAQVTTTTTSDGASSEALEALQLENQRLQQELEHVHVRIQLNARDKIHERFDDKPIVVTLQLTLDAPQVDAHENAQKEIPIVLDLSDDTPHAVNVLLQQIDNHQWDQMLFETIQPNVVRVSSQTATSSPLLEFVEDSKSCNKAGSVALQSAVVDSIIHVLYLRIYLADDAVISKNEVCIGRVAKGLDYLHLVPTVDEEDADGNERR